MSLDMACRELGGHVPKDHLPAQAIITGQPGASRQAIEQLPKSDKSARTLSEARGLC